MRARTGAYFWLVYDYWMSLDLDYAVQLAQGAAQYSLEWIEEVLLPDDCWGGAELKRKVPSGMLVGTGEHEATLWRFRLLLEMECADILQPDVGGAVDLRN
jgi:L-rhamnonate dehydratase